MASIFDAAAAGDIGAMNGFLDSDDVDIDAKEHSAAASFACPSCYAHGSGNLGRSILPNLNEELSQNLGPRSACLRVLQTSPLPWKSGCSTSRRRKQSISLPKKSILMPWGTRPCTARLRLVECSADVNVVDAHGNTPLILAGIHDKRLVASMLLWGGAERDQQNLRGNTALHEAAISGAKDVAWLIVENGGERSVRIKNQDGKTPLDIAKESGHPNADLLELLEGLRSLMTCLKFYVIIRHPRHETACCFAFFPNLLAPHRPPRNLPIASFYTLPALAAACSRAVPGCSSFSPLSSYHSLLQSQGFGCW
ncbi:fem1c [Symbiodinium sp. CCMP2456]|nr:fem1c [Symbiodinium sp. CCMP2456]